MNRGDQPYAEVIRIGGAAIFSDEIHGVLYAIALRRAHFNLYLSDVDVSWEGFRMPTIRPIARLDWSGVESSILNFLSQSWIVLLN